MKKIIQVLIILLAIISFTACIYTGKDIDTAYNIGYEDGIADGYNKDDLYNAKAEAQDDAYQRGYEDGFEAGYDSGMADSQ